MSNWFCSPTGNAAGDGTLLKPWDIATCWNTVMENDQLPGDKRSLKKVTIQPGDTIFMRGGKDWADPACIYRATGPWWLWPNLKGAPDNPIDIRGYQNELWAIDMIGLNSALLFDVPSRPGNFRGDCHDLRIWDMRLFCSNPIRSTSAAGNNGLFCDVKVIGPRIEMIGCYTHDLGNGYACSMGSDGAKLMDAVILDHGYTGSDRGHGHSGYIEGLGPTQLDNIITGGSWDILWQLFGTASKVANVTQTRFVAIEGQVQGGVQYVIGGGGQKYGIVIKQMRLWERQPRFNWLGWQWDQQNTDLYAEDILCVNSSMEFGNWDKLTVKGLKLYSKQFAVSNSPDMKLMLYTPAQPPQQFHNYVLDGNEYSDGTVFYAGARHLDVNGNPAGDGGGNTTDTAAWTAQTGETNSNYKGVPKLLVDVWPSLRRAGYAHISIYNPALDAAVTVDLSKAGLNEGDAWEIRDALNLLAPPVQTGIYTAGQTVALSMTGLVRKSGALGIFAAHSAPEFGAFVLRGGRVLRGDWTPSGVPGPPIVPPPVIVPPPPTGGPMTVNKFTATPPSLPAGGGTVSISWDIAGASGLNLTANPGTPAWGTAGGAQPPAKTISVALLVTTTFRITGAAGDFVELTVPVGGTAPPPVTKTWSATGVPPGLSMSSAGVLQGTPTQAGSFTMSVTANSSDGKSGTQPVAVSIAAADPVTTPPTGTLVISPTSVSGKVGVPLNVPFTAN